ncbi:hypothetical protein [Roseobacter fucihabitans]|uniref:hypothetical protein n=1 Tax=Roseobacter fucihabitans TaxID=1537242 RepID=UPI00165333AD|nr:hypothetical protein [Roseobacter litoralis]
MSLKARFARVRRTTNPVADTEVSEAIFGNVGNMVAFRVGVKAAPLLARMLALFSAADLQNQPNHRASVQVMARDERLSPFSASMYPPYWSAA